MRDSEQISGASSVFAAELELLGGHRLWIFRNLVLDPRHTLEMFRSTYRALDAETRDDTDPVGLCVLPDHEERRYLPPEAQWPDPRTVYAGYMADGRQVRVAYFSDQVSAMSRPTPRARGAAQPAYSVELFAEQTQITEDDVISLWTAEAMLPLEEAQRRIEELLVIAHDDRGELAGIGTTYLRHNEQLHAELWYFRAFVPAAHRKSDIAVSLVVRAREHLEDRYVGGDDRRAVGFAMVIQNEGLNRAFPKPVWYESDALLVGTDARGFPLLVHYFPGAPAPELYA